ncbi:MAG TPA: hypothetical protein VHZ03_47910 [Trebonia sp.]|nr:hypothetical protein [Trebonia sp.]
MDDYPAAAVSLDQAPCLFQDSGNRLGQASALKYLGCVQKLGGDYPSAVDQIGQESRSADPRVAASVAGMDVTFRAGLRRPRPRDAGRTL